MNQTMVEDTKVIVIVKKYGRPTLLEEQERRVVHEVTISSKKTTRYKSQDETPIVEKFHFKCTCEARKKWCIHLGLVMATQFTSS